MEVQRLALPCRPLTGQMNRNQCAWNIIKKKVEQCGAKNQELKYTRDYTRMEIRRGRVRIVFY